jgi:hypothetical protein
MSGVLSADSVRKLALVGNHLPRHCGIATFTSDLSRAIEHEFPKLDCFVLAMNDAGARHDYPSRVRFEIAESDLGSYRRAADYLNVNTVDAVCVQHEYGIFGGKAGSHVLSLLRSCPHGSSLGTSRQHDSERTRRERASPRAGAIAALTRSAFSPATPCR